MTTESKTKNLKVGQQVWVRAPFVPGGFYKGKVVKVTPSFMVDVRIRGESICRFRHDGSTISGGWRGKIDFSMEFTERERWIAEEILIQKACLILCNTSAQNISQHDRKKSLIAEIETQRAKLASAEALLNQVRDDRKED